MSSEPECKICGNYIHHGPVICERCQVKHDAAIRQEAIAEHDWLLRQNRGNLLCFYENPEELKKFKDEIAQAAREEVLEDLAAKINALILSCPSEAKQKPKTMLGYFLNTIESLRQPNHKTEVPE